MLHVISGNECGRNGGRIRFSQFEINALALAPQRAAMIRAHVIALQSEYATLRALLAHRMLGPGGDQAILRVTARIAHHLGQITRRTVVVVGNLN